MSGQYGNRYQRLLLAALPREKARGAPQRHLAAVLESCDTTGGVAHNVGDKGNDLDNGCHKSTYRGADTDGEEQGEREGAKVRDRERQALLGDNVLEVWGSAWLQQY